LFLVIKYNSVNIDKHVRVLPSIFDFLNSHRFTLGISSYLIFGFFALSSLISFGQNSLQTGLVAWYPFDGNASDMSGNGNHGTVNGATLGTDRHGQANKAYNFDGVDDFITITATSSLNITTQGSLSFWMNREFDQGGSSNYKSFVFARPTNLKPNGGYSMTDYSWFIIQLYDSGILPMRWYDGTNTTQTFVNQWVHYLFLQKTNNETALFSNGKLVTTGSANVSWSSSTQPIYIGKDPNTVTYNGRLDDVRIYNRALSSEEVSSLYRLESPNHFVEMNSTVDLEMIHVEPGTFTMGSPTSESGRNSDENSHNVTLSKGFYLGKFEVTQAQYEAVMSGITGDLNATPSNWSGNPNRPVDSVSYEDIQVFLVRLNVLESNKTQNGWAYVLPTEAQWEYACRAGTSTRYSWGNSISATDANWDHGADPNRPVDVGSFSPNAFGFHDMHGNVYEWINDWYGVYPNSSVTDPLGLQNGSQKVIRGGAYGNGVVANLRAAFRYKNSTSLRANGLGFRLAYKEVTQPPSNLMVNAPLTISENQPIGTVVGEFNATDPDVNATLTYHLISGVGDGNNSLFTIDQNGTVKTATVFDFETNASTYSIRIQARDEFNATVEGNFTVVLTDVLEDIDGDGLADHLEQVGSTQIRIRAQIDGKSRLVFKKGSIQWNHVFYAKPGQHNSANYPTTINGDLDWMPQWNYDISDEFNQTNVDLRGTVQVQPIIARNSLSIVQQPNISNGQTTIVEIFDSANGSSFYEFILTGEGLSGYLTDPQDPDSDNDGFNDGMEVTSGSDPRINTSTPLNYGLVAWYPFDGNASDMSGNGNHGTVNGATLSAARHGHANKAYSFDGIDDQIIVANHSSVNFGQGDFSLVSWMKYTGSDRGALFYKYNGNTYNNLGFVFYLVPEIRSARLFLSDGVSRYDDMLLPFNLPSSIWHQIGLSINFGSSAVVFVDGVSQGIIQISDTAGSIDNTNPLLIGSNDINSEFFNGSIDDIRIYNRALSSEEVSALYRLESPNLFVEMNSTVDLEMIWAEPGTFTMGSPTGENGRGSNETQYNVTLTKGFYLGKYEVTQAQYEAVMKGNTQTDSDGNVISAKPSYWSGSQNRPVEQVSWNDIEIFLQRLNNQQLGKITPGWSYVLPTEAQWEYACRAGTTTAYFWGDDANSSLANFNWDGTGSTGVDFKQTRDVGQYLPNPWGFYDMHGNVYEWTADYYQASPAGNFVVDPTGPDVGSTRVTRGGSWNFDFSHARSARRASPSPIGRGDYLGFRLALYQWENIPPDLNATVTGTVQYNGMIPGPAYVWALDANGTKVAEQILADGNGSYSLNVPKGAGYDFKVFIDGTGDGNPQAYEVWKHIGDWNSSLGGFNLTHVDGNLSGINFNLFDSDYDSDGFTNWQEYQAGTNQNDANSTPGLNFGLVAWYPFDGNASDMSGNGNHGTVNGATLGTDRHGQTGMAYDFDGVNDKIIVNGTWPSGNSSRSVSVWYKAPSNKGNIFTFGDGLLQKARFSVGLNFNNIHGSLGFIGQGSDQIFSVNGLYDSWNMILLTYDGLLGNLYLNGGILSESFNYILETNGSMPLIIGSNSLNRNDEFFLGSIDQVHIYDRALSAFEVQTLYQMEKPKEVLTNANFQTAVNLWFSDEANATATYGHISEWNTSAVTDMSNAFDSRSNFNEDIGGWDVSSVEHMSMMFKEASSFNKDIGNWDVSSVLSMYRIFRDATLFNQDISNWDVSRVQNLSAAFERASSFNQKISDWNISSVVSLEHLFNGASSFNQGIDSWDTSNASSMLNVFRNASSFNQDVSGWNVSKVVSMENMFLDASSFNQNISDWNISSVINFSYMLDRSAVSDVNKGLIHKTFSSDSDWPYNWGIYANTNPVELNASTPLTIVEGQLIGSLVGTFSVVDLDVNASIHFDLVDGNGSDSNHEFSLDTNGTLRTAVVFDYEGENSDNDPTLNIRVRARDEFNASVERSFMVTILDVNESTEQIPVNKNESVEHNFTNPILNQLIDGNDTAGDSNETLSIIQIYRPIPKTLDFVAEGNNTYLIRGRVLTDGGSPILESGVLVSGDILFRGEMIRLSSNNFDESPEFSVMVRNLTPGTTYYYRVYARNEMGETLGARKRLKTPEEIDLNMWFANMQNIKGGWRSSDWFGQFQQFPNVDWIYHSELGWAYIASDQKDGIWIWQNGRGWMWTQQGVWPYLFNHKTLGWLYLVKSINGNPFFYDYTIGNYSIAP
jgi:formylglycine-generating enzyme required for sulfatase activity